MTTSGFSDRTLGYGYVNLNNTLTIGLMKNEQFRDLYLQRLAYHLKTTFADDKVTSYVDAIYNEILPEMERDRDRWGFSYSDWERHVKRVRDFCVNESNGTSQKKRLLKDTKNYFGLSNEEYEHYFGDV